MSQSKNYEELLLILKKFDPDPILDEVTKIGEAWATANASAASLEKTLKTLLAKLTKEFMATGARSGAVGERAKGLSFAAAEQLALSDERVEQHIEFMVASREHADICRVRYDMGQLRLEFMRSQLATARQEMRFSSMGS